MKLSLTRSQLSQMIRVAAPAVAKSTTVPALKCYKLRGDDAGAASLSATDTELHVTANSVGQVDESGACLVPADTLATIIKLAPDGPIHFTAGKVLAISYPGGSYKIPLEDPDVFPDNRPESGRATTFTIPAVGLARLFKRVSWCRGDANDHKTFTMNGVVLEGAGSELSAVGSTTVRFSVATTRLAADVAPFTAIVSEKGIKAYLAAFDETGENVEVCVGKSTLSFSTPTATIHSTLISGKSLPWRRVLSDRKAPLSTLTDSPAALLSAIRRACVTADDADSAVVWTCTGKNLVLSMAGQKGHGEVEHACQSHDGDESPIEIKLFGSFTSAFLAAAASDGEQSVTMALVDKSQAVYFEAANWRYLEMPMVKREV